MRFESSAPLPHELCVCAHKLCYTFGVWKPGHVHIGTRKHIGTGQGQGRLPAHFYLPLLYVATAIRSNILLWKK